MYLKELKINGKHKRNNFKGNKGQSFFSNLFVIFRLSSKIFDSQFLLSLHFDKNMKIVKSFLRNMNLILMISPTFWEKKVLYHSTFGISLKNF